VPAPVVEVAPEAQEEVVEAQEAQEEAVVREERVEEQVEDLVVEGLVVVGLVVVEVAPVLTPPVGLSRYLWRRIPAWSGRTAQSILIMLLPR